MGLMRSGTFVGMVSGAAVGLVAGSFRAVRQTVSLAPLVGAAVGALVGIGVGRAVADRNTMPDSGGTP